MTTDPFTTAAKEFATKAWPPQQHGIHVNVSLIRSEMIRAAEWARDRLAASGSVASLAATHREIAEQARADGDPGRAHLHDWAADQALMFAKEQNR